MPQCVVIGDDITGVNATGVLLKKMNYSTYTVLNMAHVDMSIMDECDCLMYPTDSRGIDAETAYNRVYNVGVSLKNDDVRVYAKRIDSTLRGNLGSETDALLDVLGEEYVAIAASCFPESGRIILGGYMLVNGIPLHKTNIALDPKTPVTTSEVKPIFEKQSKYKVSQILMNEMMEGSDALASKILEHVEAGSRTIVFDCVTQEDLDLIADAVIKSGIKFVAVDPGVFTATVARKLIVPQERTEDRPKILTVVGSVNSNTKAQMEELWLSQKTYKIMVETKLLIEDEETRNGEINRIVTGVLDNMKDYDVCTITGDGLYPVNRIDMPKVAAEKGCTVDDLSKLINEAFADITYQIFKASDLFRGLYTSGGDITVAVCKAFESAGICLMDEVLPLAAYGTTLKGEFPDIHMITKGGSQGNKNAINQCITFLKEKLYM